ncbi:MULTISPECIES: 2-hydroxyacid dehydrogenase [Mycolicibacter]|uniref:D-glycerate dehydrogenase n=2 Tax=Mycolicibacter TaxID=1073531 RepID=A0ABU5XLL1_9MYCO|nr:MULTISPECIES: D-glycerate dehydrogenase [unclassified Mycolicibacter]MEB3022617.1 D-glycerate dehydrogenase [Mycolicibacter sp. MYC098]MEB3070424.1 D-glycerate dehydrogenase [Mycolicibacter sp. MYC017]
MSEPRFYVTAPIPDPGLPMLRAAGSVEMPDVAPDPAALRRACESGDYDVIIAQVRNPFDADLLRTARIRGISNFAVGYDNIDVAAATANAVMVGNTPDVLTDATADIAVLLMLAVGRRAVEADTFVRTGHFSGWRPDMFLGRDISGATLGLAGFGRIGRATARRALGFGMRVLFSPRPPGDRHVGDDELGEFAGRVRQVGWAELVGSSDYLSLHVPLTAETRHLVNAEVLRAMKSTAVLINTARGPVVDEDALVAALKAGEIAGAGLDVYEHEPQLAAGLAEVPNTVLLPHIGSATVSVRAEMARLCAENAIAMARGVVPPHPVNPEAWRS